MERESEENEVPEQDKKLSEKEKRAKRLLEMDNQVGHAVQLLEAWGIFSDIKAGS